MSLLRVFRRPSLPAHLKAPASGSFRFCGHLVRIIGPTTEREIPGSIEPIPSHDGKLWYHVVKVED